MNVKRFKLLLPHLRTISALPNYARMIEVQASQQSFDVRKDNISRTTVFSAYNPREYNQGLKQKRDGKTKVLKPQNNKDVKI